MTKLKDLQQQEPSPPKEPISDPNQPPTPVEEPSEIKPVTPPTSTDDSAEKDRLINAQAAVIQDMNRNQQSMEQRLAALETPAEPTKPVSELDQEFWKSPTQRIRQEMQDAVAPLQAFMKDTKKQSTYVELKNQFRSDPMYAPILEKAEKYVDSLMANAEPTAETLRAVLFGIRGAAAMGQLPGVDFDVAPTNPNEPTGMPVAPPVATPTPSNPSGNPMDSLPPHLRPSAPPSAVPTQQQPKPNLTENERRLAREMKLSDEEYVKWQQLGGDEVAYYDGDKPPKEG